MPRRAPARLLPAIGAGLLLTLTLLAPTPAQAVPGTITGSVSDSDSDALGGVTVDLIAPGDPAGAAALSVATGADGAFEVATPPGGAFWVRYSKPGYATTFLESAVDDGPVTVTVTGGQLSAPGIDVSDNDLGDVTLLLVAPTVRTRPAVNGTVAVGETITVTPGTWSGVTPDPDFLSVDWFLDGEDASEHSEGDWFQRFEIPARALGKEITFTLTVEDPAGARQTATYTGSAGVVAKAPERLKGTLTGTVAKKKLLVVLTVPGLPNPTGSVVVKEKRKTLGTVTLRKGKGKLKLKLAPGKHKLTLTYAGSDQVLPAKGVVKVTVAPR